MSAIVTSKAPFGLLPVFSTTIENLTRSLPSTFSSVASIGVEAMPLDVIVPVKAGVFCPGGVKPTTPAGNGGEGDEFPFCTNTPVGLSVETTPLVIASSGSPTCTCVIPGFEEMGSPFAFVSLCCA